MDEDTIGRKRRLQWRYQKALRFWAIAMGIIAMLNYCDTKMYYTTRAACDKEQFS